MYDLIVVGGGPAGSTCARRAAQKGLDVLLIEKTHHPRKKLCGGAVSPRIRGVLGFDIDSVIERRVNAARIVSPSGRSVICTREDFAGLMVKRDRFDALLLHEAEAAGAQVIQGAAVLAVDGIQSGVRVLLRGDSFRGSILVGADGVNGIVAKCVGIRRRWKREDVALCIAADVPMSAVEMKRCMSLPGEADRMAIEMYLNTGQWGFGWCFPKAREMSIGIGSRMDRMHDLKGAWNRFVAGIRAEKGIRLDLSGTSAARVPLGAVKYRRTARRVMLVGDAAGLASPVTGEGIYYAAVSGVLAADFAKETIRHKSWSHMWRYEDRLKDVVIRELSTARTIADLLFKSSGNAEIICDIAARDSVMRDLMIDFVAGTRPVNRVRKDLVRRLLIHHPIRAIRLGL